MLTPSPVLWRTNVGEQADQIGPIPTCSFARIGHAQLSRGVVLDDVQGEVPEQRHILSGILGAMARFVFSKTDVENPVQLVLDMPMPTD